MSLRRWIAVFVVSFFCPFALSGEVSCRVVGISDVDTFTCLKADRTQIRVRISSFDTPEKAQPYGQAAKQPLSALIFSMQADERLRGCSISLDSVWCFLVGRGPGWRAV